MGKEKEASVKTPFELSSHADLFVRWRSRLRFSGLRLRGIPLDRDPSNGIKRMESPVILHLSGAR